MKFQKLTALFLSTAPHRGASGRLLQRRLRLQHHPDPRCLRLQCRLQRRPVRGLPHQGHHRHHPQNPGGGTDVSTRGLIQYMKNYIDGSNFVPTNKPDGGGVTGMVETANAKADGYTLGAVTVELAMFPIRASAP